MNDLILQGIVEVMQMGHLETCSSCGVKERHGACCDELLGR